MSSAVQLERAERPNIRSKTPHPDASHEVNMRKRVPVDLVIIDVAALGRCSPVRKMPVPAGRLAERPPCRELCHWTNRFSATNLRARNPNFDVQGRC